MCVLSTLGRTSQIHCSAQDPLPPSAGCHDYQTVSDQSRTTAPHSSPTIPAGCAFPWPANLMSPASMAPVSVCVYRTSVLHPMPLLELCLFIVSFTATHTHPRRHLMPFLSPSPLVFWSCRPSWCLAGVCHSRSHVHPAPLYPLYSGPPATQALSFTSLLLCVPRLLPSTC